MPAHPCRIVLIHLTMLIVLATVAVGMASCSSASVQEPVLNQQTRNTAALAGRWRMIERKFEPDTAFVAIPDSVIYHKVITNSSFVWYYYNEYGANLIATAGGVYKLEGESYVEDIQFFYPPGSQILGATIPFRCQLLEGGNKWVHSGYIQQKEYDAQVGDYVVLSERRLEEVWVRIGD